MKKDEAHNVGQLAAHLTAAFFAGSARNPELTNDDVIAKFHEMIDEVLRSRAESLAKTVTVPMP